MLGRSCTRRNNKLSFLPLQQLKQKPLPIQSIRNDNLLVVVDLSLYPLVHLTQALLILIFLGLYFPILCIHFFLSFRGTQRMLVRLCG